ncbi:MAG: hypothetical protein Q7U85_01240 [Rhodocyclaceae bacterium]|nr:hypothetical protein [Rhodocyclaceae bacterium]
MNFRIFAVVALATACHTAAASGNYAERGLKLPGGWRRAKQR